MTALYDRDIRAMVHAALAPQQAAGARVVDELSVYWGEARVDVADIGPGHIEGWEIKSDHDSLGRLPSQVSIYVGVFDRMVLVTGDRYLGLAPTLVPSWWGLSRATPTGLETVRAPLRNPDQRAYPLASLLWRDELLGVLAAAGLDKGHRSKAKPTLCYLLGDLLPLPRVREAVLAAIHARKGWPEEQRAKPRPARPPAGRFG